MQTYRLSLTALLLPLALMGCASAPTTSAISAPADTHQPPTLLAMQEGQAPATPAIDAAPRAAATALLDSFNDEQKTAAQFPVDHANRKDWHYVPRNRPGLQLGSLSDDQRKLLHTLMQTALSDSGYLKVTDIIWLETVLAEIEKNPGYRDVNKYTVQVFGDPKDAAAAWGWRFEGHHVCINLLYADGSVSVTPMFMGTNPAVVPSGIMAGKRVLAEEHTLAIELAQSMSDEQRAKMMLKQKPRDVITGPGRETALKEAAGISIEDLTDVQKRQLHVLASSYLMNARLDHFISVSQRIMPRDRDRPIPEIHFAWAGPIDSHGVFYYRIYSPTFVIEYSCQEGNHVHAVFHDLTDPLAEDLLRKHYEQAEHQ